MGSYYKEKNMKKIIIAIVSVLVIAFTCMSFVACKDPVVDTSGIEGFGDEKPTQESATAITADMSAIEMLLAGVDNFYAADYIASNATGSIVTEVLGVKFTQFVKSQSIRNGSADGDYTMFSNNLSGSIGGSVMKVYIWEETSYTKEGVTEDIYFRSGLKKDLQVVTLDEEKGVYDMAFKEGKTFQPVEQFNDIEKYQSAKAANPTKIWMYDIDENTYDAAKSSTVVSNNDGTYTFTIVADPKLSTVEYTKQMMYMLESSGVTPDGFEFKEIKLTITIWDNGYIKSLNLTESYLMQVAGFIDTTITLNSFRQFSYFGNEEGFTPADLTEKMFTK